ncbi:glycosyltransferase 87 family protein [Sinomonas sp. JGH33]|uniref:Glycosyltransferase 87 family protein n=1 Tax=Sinomonas terricola TaxID=3110330 RepID=A0ABU5TA14_9MICC|nr:glycosyltransferase 87 family protein [Sinomonas sp. JGH33]MEA5456490.1 glycosyltransferase 87 family protein [Sinomonas sp. JGH33]
MTPRGLLAGYLVVHLGYLAFMSIFVLQGQAFSDTNIYRDWAVGGFPQNVQPSPWVYPIAGLLPIWISGLLGGGPFLILWVVLTSALNGVALGVLSGWGKKPEGIRAGWWWLVFIAIMGTLGFARVDGVTAPIVLLGLSLGVASPFAASAILAFATWMKVWPAAALVPLFAVVRDRWKVVVGGALVTAAVAAVAQALGVFPHLLDFLTTQGSRGMQLEATFTTPWLWMSVLGIGGARMYMNTEINSMQVDGPGSTIASALMQPLFVVIALAVAIVIFWALHEGKKRGHEDRAELLLAGALTMVSAFIVFNKVGSPQFIVWLGPVVALGLAQDRAAWRVPARLLLGIAVATFVVYPLFYDALSHNNPTMAFVLTVRNVLLVALFVWAAIRLVRLGRKGAPAVDQELRAARF